MNKKIAIGGVVMAWCVGLSVSTIAIGDEGEWGEHGEYESYSQRSAAVVPAKNDLYESECGACHFAYPAGFLPERSWVKLMQGLDDHFGDNASLDAASRKSILDYLSLHAADRQPQRFSHSLLRSLGSDTAPLRITQTDFFRRQHHEVPQRLVSGNKQVGSFSNCNACHTQAASGIFDEHGVRIPGAGRWED